jgi:hypothetical protein
MKSFSWHALAGFLLGIAAGLVYAWVLSPIEYVDTPPSLLREDFKDEYRAAIAAAYRSNGDLERARTRLLSLGDEDPLQAIAMQAQRTLASGGSAQLLGDLALLANALQGNLPETLPPSPTRTPRLQTPTIPPEGYTPTTPTQTVTPSRTPTLTIPNTPTPRPTRTPTPTPGKPYILLARNEICSVKLSEGLLMVYTQNSDGDPVAGAEIIVSWEGGEEHFYTGLKPELGDGYADFTMMPETAYTVRIGGGSETVSDIHAPLCEDKNGESYWGSVRLKFKQP